MRIEKDSWLRTRFIAHRGLHDDCIPENSLSAFQKAIDCNYPIEIDIHASNDNGIYVFHDDDLERMTGVKGRIEDMDKEEISMLRLGGTDEKIPTLEEVLELVNGQVPLLIEYKKNPGEQYILEHLSAQILLKYSGEFAIQSFNPFVLSWFKDNLPDILRGQLSSFFKENKLGFIQKIFLKRMWFNYKTEPDFISYNEKNIPNKYIDKYLEKFPDLTLLAWTVRDQESADKVLKYADNIIFEKFIPVDNHIKKLSDEIEESESKDKNASINGDIFDI